MTVLVSYLRKRIPDYILLKRIGITGKDMKRMILSEHGNKCILLLLQPFDLMQRTHAVNTERHFIEIRAAEYADVVAACFQKFAGRNCSAGFIHGIRLCFWSLIAELREHDCEKDSNRNQSDGKGYEYADKDQADFCIAIHIGCLAV